MWSEPINTLSSLSDVSKSAKFAVYLLQNLEDLKNYWELRSEIKYAVSWGIDTVCAKLKFPFHAHSTVILHSILFPFSVHSTVMYCFPICNYGKATGSVYSAVIAIYVGQAHTVEDLYLLGRSDVRLPSVLTALV